MSWVKIDYAKCSNCGACLEGCTRCFSKTGEKVLVHADINRCSICGRCVALCPTGAISHSQMDMANFHEIKKGNFISPDDLFEFLRQRRSHRVFTDRKIPEADIKKLVDIVRYAPTGSNSQMVELLLIQSPEKRKKLSDFTVDFMIKNGEDSGKKAQAMRLTGKADEGEIKLMEMIAFYGDMMRESRDAGLDPVFYNAPLVMIFHAPMQVFSKKDDCVIASTTVGLLSRTMGLEYTYIGIFEGAANNYPAVMNELKVPQGNSVYSVIILGYPKMKFFRTVDRKPTRVRYE
ncbi:MAG: nitroreductase family protein [Methanosarcina sp.]|nr:nitroreductase family protein [Methanosarcina sp.]